MGLVDGRALEPGRRMPKCVNLLMATELFDKILSVKLFVKLNEIFL